MSLKKPNLTEGIRSPITQMMKNLFPFILLLFGPFVFGQDANYKLINLGMNNEMPHFGLSVDPNGGVVFTSYLLNKRGK